MADKGTHTRRRRRAQLAPGAHRDLGCARAMTSSPSPPTAPRPSRSSTQTSKTTVETIDVVITDLKMPRRSTAWRCSVRMGEQRADHSGHHDHRLRHASTTRSPRSKPAPSTTSKNRSRRNRSASPWSTRRSNNRRPTGRRRRSCHRARHGIPGRFGLVGDSPAMSSIYEVIETVADTRVHRADHR